MTYEFINDEKEIRVTWVTQNKVTQFQDKEDELYLVFITIVFYHVSQLSYYRY